MKTVSKPWEFIQNVNMKSLKKLSWMCLDSDFGLIFGVHFDVGCLFGMKNNLKRRRKSLH